MDPYKALGVDKNASESEIKKAYRKLALKHHPDKGGGKESEGKFKEATAAYEILGDKQKKQQYDQFGSVGGAGGVDFDDFAQNFNFKNVNFDFSGFGDIFDTFFGGGGRRSQQQKGPIRGGDIEIVLHLTFEEAIFGTTKEVEISRYEACENCKGMGNEPGSKIINCETCSGTGQHVRIQQTPLGQIQTASTCSDCHGAGQVPEKKCTKCRGEFRILQNQTMKIKIPEGMHDKAAIRLTGKGEAGLKGGTPGDLFAHISVGASREFVREGNDIRTTQNIHLLQAVLGDEINIKTVHGNVKLKIPAGTENGKVFKVKNYGVPKVNVRNPKLKTEERGDHFVKITVDIPKKINKKEKEFYLNLAKEAKMDIKPQSKGLFG